MILMHQSYKKDTTIPLYNLCETLCLLCATLPLRGTSSDSS